MKTIDPHYTGFYLEQPLGNNRFSWERRSVKKIWVPALVEGHPSQLKSGSRIVFSEWEEERECNHTGLEFFIFWNNNGVPVYFFDNHNHAFYFWHRSLNRGDFSPGLPLVHVDQHSDMRRPPEWLPANADDREVFDYTGQVLNVGNFIQPALRLGWFREVDIVDSSQKINRRYEQPLVLDLDMDFFAPEMDYIDRALKVAQIRKWLRLARCVTVATSPFFMDQQEAIELIGEIFR